MDPTRPLDSRSPLADKTGAAAIRGVEATQKVATTRDQSEPSDALVASRSLTHTQRALEVGHSAVAELDSQVVDQVSAAIAEGSYEVDSGAVADAVLAEAGRGEG